MQKKSKPKRSVLIDGDILVYRACCSVEQEIDWGDDIWTLTADLPQAKQIFTSMLSEIEDVFTADNLVVALSDTVNWRKKVYPDYKANRTGRKPVIFKPMRQWVSDTYNVYQRPELEGDDIMGILATSDELLAGRKLIYSIDKDMRQIPGFHSNGVKGEQFYVEKDAGDLWHMIQTLTGDPVDGYPGCPGIGSVTAEKLLADVKPEDRWDVVLRAYAKKGLSEDYALTQARVARICRASDFNFDTKKVILWEPPVKSAV